MRNQLTKLSIAFLGFIAGIAFLINCGGSSSINNAVAGTLPVINDQMFCAGLYSQNAMVEDSSVGNVGDTLVCMKQSSKVEVRYQSLAGVYAENWIMISMEGYGTVGQYLFYK